MNKFTQRKSKWLPQKRRLALGIACLLLALRGLAQTQALDKPVSLSLSNTNLSAVVAELDRQSELTFTYDRAALSAVKMPAATWQQVPLKKVLQELNLRTGLTYMMSENTLALKLATRPHPGTVKGRIVDFETAEPLPGATVQLDGSGIGAITDARGFYELKAVPAGSCTLVTTFIGYQRAVVSNVQVKADETQSYDVKMQAGGSLKEVVVSDGPHKVKAVTHSTEQQLLQEIKGATGVVSGISNELISRTADRNAAEVVKRISGVTVVDDRFIVVRGMNERYNLTYLNSNIAPSTELYNKAFAYDLLPSSVIDKIIVYKSPVANLVADYAGAAVRVYTKNAMPVKHFDIGVQVAHRPGSTMTTVNSYNGGKYDFLGFDDDTRKLPSFSPGIMQSTKQVGNNVLPETFIKGFTSTLDYGTRHSTPDLQAFLNYYNNWKIGHARLYDLTALTYTKETTFRNIRTQYGNTNAFALDTALKYNQQTATNNRIVLSQQTVETGKINLLENLTLKLNDRHQFSFNNFFVNEGRRLTNINTTYQNALPQFDNLAMHKKDITLSFMQRLLYAGNLQGQHALDKKHNQQLDWNLGYTYDLQDVPDQRIMHFLAVQYTADSGWVAAGSNASGFDTPSYGYQGMITRLFIKNIEQVYNGSLDYSWHVLPSFDVKAGAYALFKTRELGRRFFRVNRAGLNADLYPHAPSDDQGWWNGYGYNDPSLLQFRPQDLSTLWNAHYFPNDGSGLAVYDATSPIDAYAANERYLAFYAMGDWKLAQNKVTLNAGLRAEADRQRLAGAEWGTANAIIVPVYVDHKKLSWLPSFNISYRSDSALVLRASYGRTVNRPDFRELTPYNDFDFQNNQEIVGNPNVVTATIDNADLRAEFYPQHGNKNEVYNVGVFYKYIDKPIERMFYDVISGDYSDGFGFPIISYGNAIHAKLYGAEAEIKKSLAFIPGKLFRNLTVMLNGTVIKSTTLTHEHYIAHAIDSTRQKGEPLQGQSPYTFNGGLFYENPSWGTKIGLVYNVSGARIYAKSIRTGADTTFQSTYTRPDLLQLPMHLLDLSISQRIVRSLQVKFSIQNLLDQAYRIAEDGNYNQHYDREKPVVTTRGTYYQGDDISTYYKPGRYLLLQFTYAF